MMNTSKKSRHVDADPKLRSIIAAIVRAVDPDKLILFGSRARGADNTQSDYDILVLKRGVTNERIISRAAYRSLLDEGADAAVDIVVFDEEKFEAAKGRRGTILSEIAMTGMAVYERA
jgi:predicted nucleotidyltransferase